MAATLSRRVSGRCAAPLPARRGPGAPQPQPNGALRSLRTAAALRMHGCWPFLGQRQLKTARPRGRACAYFPKWRRRSSAVACPSHCCGGRGGARAAAGRAYRRRFDGIVPYLGALGSWLAAAAASQFASSDGEASLGVDGRRTGTLHDFGDHGLMSEALHNYVKKAASFGLAVRVTVTVTVTVTPALGRSVGRTVG